MLPKECALVSSALADRQYLIHIRRPAFLVGPDLDVIKPMQVYLVVKRVFLGLVQKGESLWF